MSKKALVLSSGGIDSATYLYKIRDRKIHYIKNLKKKVRNFYEKI